MMLTIECINGTIEFPAINALETFMPSTNSSEKLCPHCERTLPVANFYRSSQTKDGLTNWCQGCIRNRNKTDYAKRVGEEKPQVESKKCCTCKITKTRSEFGSRKESWDGLRSYCKECGTDKNRQHNLKKAFGIHVEEYDAIHDYQNGVCAICLNPQNGKRLAVDHCHSDGVVRGLLCDQCNRSLGGFGDDIELLKAAIRYLETVNERSLKWLTGQDLIARSCKTRLYAGNSEESCATGNSDNATGADNQQGRLASPEPSETTRRDSVVTEYDIVRPA